MGLCFSLPAKTELSWCDLIEKRSRANIIGQEGEMLYMARRLLVQLKGLTDLQQDNPSIVYDGYYGIGTALSWSTKELMDANMNATLTFFGLEECGALAFLGLILIQVYHGANFQAIPMYINKTQKQRHALVVGTFGHLYRYEAPALVAVVKALLAPGASVDQVLSLVS